MTNTFNHNKFFLFPPMLFMLVLSFMTTEARAARKSGTIFGYNLGLSYDASANHAEILYDTPSTKTIPEDCVENSERAGVFRCTAYLGSDGTGTGTVGVFLEKPFQRQGFFYFEPGFTFSSISYKGNLISKPATGVSGKGEGKLKPAPGSSPDPTVQPLTKASLEFYGINWQAYARFGLTPPILPDILISIGGGLQTVAGRVRLFKETYTRYVVQPEVFGSAEMIFLRIHTGSLSAYIAQDQSFVSQLGTTLVDDYPSDSSLSNIRVGLSSSAMGIRLLFPF
jgi:hypothetical protein